MKSVHHSLVSQLPIFHLGWHDKNNPNMNAIFG